MRRLCCFTRTGLGVRRVCVSLIFMERLREFADGPDQLVRPFSDVDLYMGQVSDDATYGHSSGCRRFMYIWTRLKTKLGMTKFRFISFCSFCRR